MLEPRPRMTSARPPEIARCPVSPPKVWNAYAGGFYLRSRSACVPLKFRVGRRAKTVRFGLGKRC